MPYVAIDGDMPAIGVMPILSSSSILSKVSC
jgi:hypothetical protein